MTDYERLYAEQDHVCGAPFPEFVRFFDEFQAEQSVLDLSCGQGRDALVAARRGHRVVAVDLSASGVRQLVAKAGEEGLTVTGVAADIVEYEPSERFDVVVLDRVLHMLPNDDQRALVLRQVVDRINPAGHLLGADTPKNIPMIRAFMEREGTAWTAILGRKGYRFWRRQGQG